jgi:uroporphyrinogen decarboxylase
MNKRERVMAAVRGEAVDRVPVSFWLHNFAQEHSAKALADETVRLYRAFDWDFLKPQSRATCFAEMWGMQITPSPQRAVPYGVRALPCKGPEDFGNLQPVDASGGALGEQLEALLDIRRRVGAEPPMVSTIFAPMMTATFMLPGGRDAVIAMMRDQPRALEAGLAAIGRTLADYARNCVQAGLDGVFYATTVATRPLMSVEQCRRFQRAYDLPILQAAAGAPFNILHVCQDDTLFDEFVDYPVQVFSWATSRGNPSLAEARQKTGKAVLGGLPAKPEIGRMKADELVKIAHRSIAETGGRHHLLGPGCSINPDTPEELMRAVGAEVARR